MSHLETAKMCCTGICTWMIQILPLQNRCYNLLLTQRNRLEKDFLSCPRIHQLLTSQTAGCKRCPTLHRLVGINARDGTRAAPSLNNLHRQHQGKNDTQRCLPLETAPTNIRAKSGWTIHIHSSFLPQMYSIQTHPSLISSDTGTPERMSLFSPLTLRCC